MDTDYPFDVLVIKESWGKYESGESNLAPEGRSLSKCLTYAYYRCIIICIRTTLNIDDALLAQAREYTGETEKTALVRMGLEALIQREAARRLAALGGTMRSLSVPARRRLPVTHRK